MYIWVVHTISKKDHQSRGYNLSALKGPKTPSMGLGFRLSSMGSHVTTLDQVQGLTLQMYP